MTSIAKLKDRARKHEQKEDWKAAIEAYQKVLEAEEGQDELDLELGLYNRVGDLYLRLGQTDQAVSYYETAADKYAESGFYNNAIALCNKALRHRPERPQTYLKLSRLCLEQGFLPDARRWILDYAERMVKTGKPKEAVTGLQSFVDETDDPDVRELLARHLAHQDRDAEAVDQLRKAHRTFLQREDRDAADRVAGRARELDPAVDLTTHAEPDDTRDLASGGVPRPAAGPPGSGAEEDGAELAGLESHTHDAGTPEAASGLEGLESTHHDAATPVDESADVGGLETFEESDEPEPEPLPLLDDGYDEEPEDEPAPLPLLDDADADAGADAAGEPHEEPAAGAEPEAAREPEDGAEEPEAEEPETREEPAVGGAPKPPPLVAGLEAAAGGGDGGASSSGTEPEDPMAAAEKYGIEPMDLDFTELSFGPSDMTGDPADMYEDIDVDAVLNRARELVSRALTSEALKELRILSGSDASPEVFRHALGVANEIVRHEANDIGALQARVEFAGATGDQELLVGAYLDLADALARLGSETKARAMYERVLDLEPENEAAREALGAPGEDGDDDAIDLDAILREMEVEGGVGSVPEPTDPAFAAMLSQLRTRVAEKGEGEGEDAGDHYDLGLAFKEMGLVDEAIAEFQTALTAGEERLKVYEELGQCFVLKRQYTVALKIFKRALQMPHEDATELLGVYYLLGQCYEELGQRAEAREAYEKVLSIDDSFADVPARVARL